MNLFRYPIIRRLTVTLRGLAVLGLVSLPLATFAADATPPSAPQNFEATISKGSATINLNWSVSTDDTGVKAYRIDRSLDRIAWKTLSDSIVVPGYIDTTAGFGLHYFYRLNAMDVAGNASAWVTTDVTTEDLSTAKGGSAEATYKSVDGRAIAVAPAGMVASEISCTMDTYAAKKIGTNSEPGVMGPYQLNCRTTAGSIVTEYLKPLAWTFDLDGKLTGLKNPQAQSYGSEDKPTVITAATYDEKTFKLAFSAPATSSVGVTASKPHDIVSLSWVVIILVVIAVVYGIVLLAINRKKKLDYEAHMRAKYYEL